MVRRFPLLVATGELTRLKQLLSFLWGTLLYSGKGREDLFVY